MANSVTHAAPAEEEAVRADAYVLLARLLAGPPTESLLDFVRGLQGGPGEWGEAVGLLASAARGATLAEMDDEYHALFVGLERGELAPYASHYLTGLVYDKPLVGLRDDMARLGVARDETIGEPEDHIAILCEVMAGLILGAFDERPAPVAEQRRFFEAHLANWAPRFFRDLAQAPSAALYAPVGRLGSLFLEVERQAFAYESES